MNMGIYCLSAFYSTELIPLGRKKGVLQSTIHVVCLDGRGLLLSSLLPTDSKGPLVELETSAPKKCSCSDESHPSCPPDAPQIVPWAPFSSPQPCARTIVQSGGHFLPPALGWRGKPSTCQGKQAKSFTGQNRALTELIDLLLYRFSCSSPSSCRAAIDSWERAGRLPGPPADVSSCPALAGCCARDTETHSELMWRHGGGGSTTACLSAHKMFPSRALKINTWMISCSR